MKKNIAILILMTVFSFSYGQKPENVISMKSDKSIDTSDLRNILNFEGIEFLKLRFNSNSLVGKSYHITVKEIWNGKIKSESDIVNSKNLPLKQLQVIKDTTFSIDIISRHTFKNKLKILFRFPGVGIQKQFDATESESYSLRNLVEENQLKIESNKKFYLLSYIMPYEKDGVSRYCAVVTSGKTIENWGKEFGIKHYLVFEMIFE